MRRIAHRAPFDLVAEVRSRRTSIRVTRFVPLPLAPQCRALRLVADQKRHLSNAKVEHVIGDGRLSLERESSRGFDLLAIDAFSGDAVPMHLLTREAMAIYVRHLKPGGAIVFQATNRFVNLLPVIRRLADEFGMQTLWVDDEPQLRKGFFAFGTDQVIVTKNTALLHAPTLEGVGKPAPARADLATFTDDYYNLLRILN